MRRVTGHRGGQVLNMEAFCSGDGCSSCDVKSAAQLTPSLYPSSLCPSFGMLEASSTETSSGSAGTERQREVAEDKRVEQVGK